MNKVTRGALPCTLSLEKGAPLPLYQQLVHQLRQSVVKRELNGGTRLPSSRKLADQLGVSRLTVQCAYERLVEEGYLEARVGSGTYVQPTVQTLRSQRNWANPAIGRPPTNVISSRGRRVFSATTQTEVGKGPRAFQPGMPAVDIFPLKLWGQLMHRRLLDADPEFLTEGSREGYWPLRAAIADHLRDARAVACEPAQVIIVSSPQRAYSLATWLLLETGDQVWFEDPGNPSARDTMAAEGAQIQPVPVDHEGLDLAAATRRNPAPAMIYTTPSGQVPTGRTMGSRRRQDLLKLAREVGAWILEDDCDGEFRYTDRPPPAFQALDDFRCVIHIGGFGKMLLPSLRLSYLVVPQELVEVFATAAALFDRPVPMLHQAVVADFITEGHFHTHLRKLRQVSAERQSALIDALRGELGGLVQTSASPSGLQLVAWLPEHINDRIVSARAQDAGFGLQPLSAFAMRPGPPGLVMGFAAMPPEQIRQGVRDLGALIC